MANKVSFVCPSCDFEDFGEFCSKCGSKLQVEPGDFLDLLAKRFLGLGFENLADNSHLESPLKELSNALRNGIDKHDRLIAADTFQLGRSRLIYINSFIDADERPINDVRNLVEETVRILDKEKITLRKAGVGRIAMKIYLVYRNGCSPLVIKPFKATSRIKRFFSFVFLVNVIAVDVRAKELFSLGYEEDSRTVKAALGQVVSVQSTDDETPSIWSDIKNVLFAVGFGTLREFWSTWHTLMSFPTFYGRLIANKKTNVNRALVFLVLSYAVVAIIGSVIEWFSGRTVTVELNVFPIFNYPLYLLLIIVALLFLSTPMNHGVMMLAGGKGSFRGTFLATVYFAAIMTPIWSMVEGMVLWFWPNDPTIMQIFYNGFGPASVFSYLVPFLSMTHKISPTRVTAFIFLGSGSIIIVLVAFVFFLAGIFR